MSTGGAAGGPAPPPGGGPPPGPDHHRWSLARRIAVGVGLGLVIIVLLAVVGSVIGSGGIGRTRYSSLQPGQCFDRTSAGSGEVTVERVSCASPHNAEAVGRIEGQAGPWPGLAGFDADDATACQHDASLYVIGGLRSGSEPSLIYPTASAWADGNRLVVCEVRTEEGNKIRGTFSAG